MKDKEDLIVQDLVLLGGGHAHVHLLKMFGMKPVRGLRVTLITRDVDTPYSGMVPGFVAGYYTKDDCHIDLRMICSFSGIKLLHVAANKLDLKKKLIYFVDGRPPIHYDILSIDIGITPKPLPNNLGLISDRLTPVKPIDSFASRWYKILDRVLQKDPAKKLKMIVVGGGAGGTELSFAIHYRFHKELQKRGRDINEIEFTLLNRSSVVLASHNS